MREVALLDGLPRSARPIAEHRSGDERHREVARRFGREYFDGTRSQGYGGYHYDGRWLPVARRLQDHFGLGAGSRVLDVGCAKGFLLHDLRQVVPGLAVAGLDISAYALGQAPGDIRPALVRGTAEHLPFRDGSFDLVLSINTLHNLDRAACIRALREIERVSRRHKYVQVDSWFTGEQRDNLLKWVLTAVTYYDPPGWRQLFAEAGYTGDYYWTITE
ncbi:MAG: class I SAM-dependent methyltransferase [Acidobacteriota bacterium]